MRASSSSGCSLISSEASRWSKASFFCRRSGLQPEYRWVYPTLLERRHGTDQSQNLWGEIKRMRCSPYTADHLKNQLENTRLITPYWSKLDKIVSVYQCIHAHKPRLRRRSCYYYQQCRITNTTHDASYYQVIRNIHNFKNIESCRCRWRIFRYQSVAKWRLRSKLDMTLKLDYCSTLLTKIVWILNPAFFPA